MKFCIIRRKDNQQVLCTDTYNACYSEVTHSIETDFVWSSLSSALGEHGAHNRIVIFESIDAARSEANYRNTFCYEPKEVLEFILLEDVYAAFEKEVLSIGDQDD